MSLVVLEITVPAKTPASDAVYIERTVPHAIIERVELSFPDGCAGALGVQLCDHNSRFAPDMCSSHAWIRDDDRAPAWTEAYRLSGPPWTVRMYAHNIARDHEHTVQARLVVVPHSLGDQLERIALQLERLKKI